MPPRILVVDDLEHNRELFRTILEDAGFAVELAGNGHEAVEAVASAHYDLVLMDIQMPIMDGLVAAQAIRQLGHLGEVVPIIGITGNAEPRSAGAFHAAGIDDHLGKPFRRARLIEKVTEWLQTVDRTSLKRRPGPEATLHRQVEGSAASEFSDLVRLMGAEWVLAALAFLRQQIAETFEGSAVSDAERVAKLAHAIVSHAGLLGFRDLAHSCSILEEACVSGQRIGPAFRQARTTALDVIPLIDDLKDNLTAMPQGTGSGKV